MIINQKRVNGISKLKGLSEGAKIIVAVKNPARDKLAKMGFGSNESIGVCILPKVIGPASRLNADGKYQIHRDLEKEICYRMQEWTYKQFDGPDRFVEVTDSVVVPYSRYPRTQMPPYSIEYSVDEENEVKVLTSPVFIFGIDNEKIIVAINVLLEYFGYCEIITEGFQSSIRGELRKLNWRILPKGKVPWEIQKDRIEPFLSKAKGSNRKVIDKRLETINRKSPDFTAIGEGGFSGYVIHGFLEKGLYVLESVQVNNATYVLSNDWEEISKLTKAEILGNDLHEYRIIHNQKWYELMEKVLS